MNITVAMNFHSVVIFFFLFCIIICILFYVMYVLSCLRCSDLNYSMKLNASGTLSIQEFRVLWKRLLFYLV